MTRILSLDFGTLGVRAGVSEVGRSGLCGTGEGRYETRHPHPGWAEQDPEEWWRAAAVACRQALLASGSSAIDAVCVATTASTVVACRRDGQVLRPALLWMDCRAAAEAALTERVDHPVMAYSGGGDAAEWLVPKAMWLARHEPQVWREAGIVCEALDFVNFRLTGRWVGSRMNATCKWNYDGLEGRFHREIYAAMGVPDLAARLPAEIVPVGGRIGEMRAEAAEHLGIEGRPLVAQGGIDAHIGILGAGTAAPGGMLFIGGTSVVELTQTAERRDVPGIWGPYPNALMDGYWLFEGGQVSAGSILNWLTQRIFGLDEAGTAALAEEAASFAPGTTGLLSLDYWMGNRTPYRDPTLRGAIFGLSLWHDRAALYRSAVESIAIGSANVLDALEGAGVAIDRIVVAGGIRRNPLWLRATVDALGRPLHCVPDDNLSLVGAAAAAATALGIVPDLAAASSLFATRGEIIEPDARAHLRYREMLALYREATDASAPIAHRLAAPPPAEVGSGQDEPVRLEGAA